MKMVPRHEKLLRRRSGIQSAISWLLATVPDMITCERDKWTVSESLKSLGNKYAELEGTIMAMESQSIYIDEDSLYAKNEGKDSISRLMPGVYAVGAEGISEHTCPCVLVVNQDGEVAATPYPADQKLALIFTGDSVRLASRLVDIARDEVQKGDAEVEDIQYGVSDLNAALQGVSDRSDIDPAETVDRAEKVVNSASTLIEAATRALESAHNLYDEAIAIENKANEVADKAAEDKVAEDKAKQAVLLQHVMDASHQKPGTVATKRAADLFRGDVEKETHLTHLARQQEALDKMVEAAENEVAKLKGRGDYPEREITLEDLFRAECEAFEDAENEV